MFSFFFFNSATRSVSFFDLSIPFFRFYGYSAITAIMDFSTAIIDSPIVSSLAFAMTYSTISYTVATNAMYIF